MDSGEGFSSQGPRKESPVKPPATYTLPTTDHAPSQSKGSLDRLDEKPLDLGPPLPPKAEAVTFSGDRQTPRPGSAGEVGLAKRGGARTDPILTMVNLPQRAPCRHRGPAPRHLPCISSGPPFPWVPRHPSAGQASR